MQSIMKFGEKIRTLREKSGLTQAELAELLGVNKRTVIGYEREGHYPRQRAVYQNLADTFHVPVDYLYTEKVSFFENAESAYGKKGRQEAQLLAQELSELFIDGELTDEDIDGVMIVMQKAYFNYKEDKLKAKGKRG